MAIKIENQATHKIPKFTEKHLNSLLESIPKEHLRGLDKIRIVNRIVEPQLKNTPQVSNLPGLYRPKVGIQAAMIEIAVEVLLQPALVWHKRIMPRLSYKANLAALLFSLVGQHYHLTLKHSVKRNQLEYAVRSYTEKQMRKWQEGQQTFRSKLFRPLQPTLERWGKALQKRAAADKNKEKKRA